MYGFNIKTHEELEIAFSRYDIPIEIINDVNNRISDWLESGGNITDSYIKQQFRYVENYII